MPQNAPKNTKLLAIYNQKKHTNWSEREIHDWNCNNHKGLLAAVHFLQTCLILFSMALELWNDIFYEGAYLLDQLVCISCHNEYF